MRFVPLVSCLAIACAAPDLEGACKNYVQAENGCNRDYAKEKGIEPVVLDDALCDADTSESSDDELQAAVDRYDCKADAYASANCRDADAYEGAVAAAASCDE